VASDRLKKVIAFFYGNGVPCFIACRFFQVCNGTASRSEAVSKFVNEQFHEWYYVWMISLEKIHMSIYYDMKVRTHTYINGSYYRRHEPVIPELPVVNFGIDNTYCRRQILNTLANIEMVDVTE
jgi:hypothetical protein